MTRRLARQVALLLTGVAVVAFGFSNVPSYALSPRDAKSYVTGGIDLCSGIPNPDAPRYAAGTATVLRGHVSWQGAGSEGKLILPTAVVARARVVTDGSFWFTLLPGDYVLAADYSPAAEVIQWTDITVRAGVDMRVDIPNMCI